MAETPVAALSLLARGMTNFCDRFLLLIQIENGINRCSSKSTARYNQYKKGLR